MRIVVPFDLESLRDAKIPFEPKVKMRERETPCTHECDRIELFDANPFPPPPCHQIACISYAVLEDYVPKRLKVVGSFDDEVPEEDQLRSFISYVETVKPTLVSWNGRGFDMPVIMTRAMKYGISAPWWYNDRNTRYRYSQTGHFDVMDVLSDFGAAPKSHLEQIARLCGLPGKPEGVDGSKVDEMLSKPGGLSLVKSYCLSDVFQTTVVFLRFELLRGEIDLDTYRFCVSALRELVGKAQMPAGFSEKIDWDAVLLETTHKAEPRD